MTFLLFILISFVLLLISSRVYAANESPTSDITDELLSTTLSNYTDKNVVDQLALQIPFMNKMITSPYATGSNGGHRISVPIRSKKTDGLDSFGMGDTISPQRKPVVGTAWATFKQALAYVMFDWVEERMNSGPGKIIDIVAARLEATLQDAKEDFQTMLWADGTGSGGDDFMGIQGLIPTDPRTGTIMGYDRSLTANLFWRPWYWDGSTYGPHSLTASAGAPSPVGAFGSIGTNTQQGIAVSFKYFQTGWNSTQNGESPSDCFWISDQAIYEYYTVDYPLYQHNVEIALNEDLVNFGFGGAKFMNADWIYDTNANGAPVEQLRLINQKHLYLYKDTGAWMVWLPERTPFNQLSRARYFVLRGNVVASNFRKQAVWHGITAWA